MDIEIARCTRRCAATGRELAAGEAFYSVLMTEGAEVARYDYAADGWPGPPEDCLGWWRSRMPERDDKKGKLAPNDVLLQLFHQLEPQADKQDMRYVLALLLVRRRVFQLQEPAVEDSAAEWTPGEVAVYCPRDDNTYRVASVMPDDERVEQIQEELARLLFADEDEEDSEAGGEGTGAGDIDPQP